MCGAEPVAEALCDNADILLDLPKSCLSNGKCVLKGFSKSLLEV